ncbi:hypothetical protein ACL9RL_17975 [Plantibacter sp. Mn2098]|uniref:hypothetical protein n=1 Tax=Plantibacter sp. Mn2098 TaxID=3395266 RepID=UPI003BE2B476
MNHLSRRLSVKLGAEGDFNDVDEVTIELPNGISVTLLPGWEGAAEVAALIELHDTDDVQAKFVIYPGALNQFSFGAVLLPKARAAERPDGPSSSQVTGS